MEERPGDIAATVLFYGTRGGKYEKTRSAFLGHFAENDPFESESGRKKLEKTLSSAGRETTFHVYPETNHWFFEKDRPEYRAEAARLAWKRTLEFPKDLVGIKGRAFWEQMAHLAKTLPIVIDRPKGKPHPRWGDWSIHWIMVIFKAPPPRMVPASMYGSVHLVTVLLRGSYAPMIDLNVMPN